MPRGMYRRKVGADERAKWRARQRDRKILAEREEGAGQEPAPGPEWWGVLVDSSSGMLGGWCDSRLEAERRALDVVEQQRRAGNVAASMLLVKVVGRVTVEVRATVTDA